MRMNVILVYVTRGVFEFLTRISSGNFPATIKSLGNIVGYENECNVSICDT